MRRRLGRVKAKRMTLNNPDDENNMLANTVAAIGTGTLGLLNVMNRTTAKGNIYKNT